MHARIHITLVSAAVALSVGANAQSTPALEDRWGELDAKTGQLEDALMQAQELLLPKAQDSARQKANYEEIAFCATIFQGSMREVTHLRRYLELEPHVTGVYGRELIRLHLNAQTRRVAAMLTSAQPKLASATARAENQAVKSLCTRARELSAALQEAIPVMSAK